MKSEIIRAERVALDVPATSLSAVLEVGARLLSAAVGRPEREVYSALEEYSSQGSIATGNGVAIPHASLEGLEALAVALVRTRTAVEVPGRPDEAGVTIFFFVLAAPDARDQHLQVLAHIARLALNPETLQRLRESGDVEAVARIVSGTAGAVSEGPAVSAPRETGRELLLLEIEGEATVDRLLVELADHEFGDAVVIECQTLRDALSRELPLFSGFRELFGDPGGRRLVLLTLPAESTDLAVRLVRRTCRETGAPAGRVMSVPLARIWDWRPADSEPGGRH